MTLDRQPSDAELLAKLAERTQDDPSGRRRIVVLKTPAMGKTLGVSADFRTAGGVVLGPNSPLAQPARRSKREMNDSEHVEQSKFMAWAREDATLAAHPELWLFYAVPNFSGNLPGYVAQRLKEEGRRAGVLDTHLPVARGRFHSLWIEFKAEGGKPSKEQRDWIARLRGEGHRVEISFTADAAQAIALHYLSLPPQPRSL